MDRTTLHHILAELQNGARTVAETADLLAHLPSEEMDYACLDHQRSLRTGIPEMIFGAGKSAEQIAAIMKRITTRCGRCLATRVDAAKAAHVMKALPESSFHTQAEILTTGREPAADQGRGTVLVVGAGTSDIIVAEEAVITLRFLGHRVETLYDVGVAGIHRLFKHHDRLTGAAVIIVVAGMEGALPSVIGGLVSCPVIGVPTSIGYGTGLGGIAALLSMLNSCAPGITVVNIDNGFGAACAAAAMNRH